MSDEEAVFNVWFSVWHARNMGLTSDVLGYRAVMLSAWKARASLHCSPSAAPAKPAAHGTGGE